MLEQAKRVRSSSPEKEGAAETTCDGLITATIPCPLAPLGRCGGCREFVSKAEPGKKGGVGGKEF